MPNSCSNCELCACYTESKGEVYRCDITMTPVKHFEKRLHDCQLVEVPPHVRLVWDRHIVETFSDAICDEAKKTGHVRATFDEIFKVVNDIPTIIEAEGE